MGPSITIHSDSAESAPFEVSTLTIFSLMYNDTTPSVPFPVLSVEFVSRDNCVPLVLSYVTKFPLIPPISVLFLSTKYFSWPVLALALCLPYGPLGSLNCYHVPLHLKCLVLLSPLSNHEHFHLHPWRIICSELDAPQLLLALP